MQLFAKTGYESQETKGFGWVDGEVKKINNINKKIKLPHTGWNQIELKNDCFLFSNIKNKSHFYFIHSYEFITKEKEHVTATTNYNSSIIASIVKDNIVGTQFHPEKSQKNGLVILENFLNWKLK
jgi:glutamine amidotransferase